MTSNRSGVNPSGFVMPDAEILFETDPKKKPPQRLLRGF
jgi:hypothetical protein